MLSLKFEESEGKRREGAEKKQRRECEGAGEGDKEEEEGGRDDRREREIEEGGNKMKTMKREGSSYSSEWTVASFPGPREGGRREGTK